MSGDTRRTIGSLETWEPEDKSFSKHILHPGSGEDRPNDGAVCTVSLTLVDDETISDKDLGGYQINDFTEITIGEGDTNLSELFDKVVCSMKENETCYVKSKMDAQGNKSSEFLPSNKPLKFNMCLKTFNRSAEIEDLENDEKIEKAQHHKDKATELFKENCFDFAIKRYNKAMVFLQSLENTKNLPKWLKQQLDLLKIQCYNNLGACYLKQQKYDDVVTVSSSVIELDVENVKALFRRGQAHAKLHQYTEAMADFEKALVIEPENNAVKNQLRNVDQMIRKEKDLYKKMFV